MSGNGGVQEMMTCQMQATTDTKARAMLTC